MSDLKSESYYGLALVLGGAELSMHELVSLYATLVNEGRWHPLRMTQEATRDTAKKLMSAEASYLVWDMLKRDTKISMAWKTGTSSGYRDAWTIGVIGPYVLAVWIGNFNNQGNPMFVGKQIAAPLFSEITHAIHTQIEKIAEVHRYPDRLNLTKVEVCKASGLLPTRYCKETESVWFIPGKSPIKTDTIYREVAIDAKTGLRACRFDNNTQFKIYEFWSSDLLRIFKRAGIQRRIPPPYNADCTMGSKAETGFVPQIISPQTHVNYIARMSLENKIIIPLTAVVDAGVSNVYWFLNETFMGKISRDKSLLWHAKPGKFVVRIVDDYGRSDARDVIVSAEK